jgi:AraC family transcriptional regulator, arabinose operon regulatory protein
LTNVTASESGADVLFAGRQRVERRGWSRPELPGAWLMTYTIVGHGRYRTQGIEFSTNAGDVVLVARDAPIEHSSAASWDRCYVRFDPWPGWQPLQPFVRLADGLYRAHVHLVPTRQRIEDAFRRLIGDLRSRHVRGALGGRPELDGRKMQRIMDARRQLALTALSEILLLITEDPLESESLDPRVVGVLQVVTDDLAASHDVVELSRTTGLSPSRFRQLFREQMGLSFGRAVRSLRLQQAALRLVHTDDLVGTIADETGFASIFDFSRQFRRHYGVSPRHYRERARTLELPPATARSPRASTRGRPRRGSG